jgi:predicted peptidase
MRYLTLLGVLCAMTCAAQGNRAPAADSIAKLPDAAAAKTTSLNPEFVLLNKPEADSKDKLSLLIYLHGAGGVGSDIGKVARQSRSVVDNLKKSGISAIIVAPQATKSPKRDGGKGGWLVADLDILLAHLLETLPIDPDRVYLTGNSMGGYGTFMWAGYKPEHFAAIAPMVGGIGPLGPKDITKDLELWGKNLATLPMRAYYGGKDKVVPPDRGKMIMDAIKKAGGGDKAEVIVLEEQSHGAGRIPYSQPEFYKWLFSHTRKPAK